jgi:hypothetical protein
LIISFGLAFFMGGFSETFTPVLVVLLGGMIAITGWHSNSAVKTASRLFLSAGFLGALLSLAVMIFAPGNSIRRSYFPAPPDLFTILRVASASYLNFLSDAFRSPYLLTGLVGSTLGSVWLGMRINREAGIAPLQGWQIAAILFAGLLLAFGCFPTAVYATSEPPPARTLINPAFILVLCFLISGFFLGEWLINRAPNSVSLTLPLLIAAGSLIVLSSWNGFQRLYAMRDEHILFAQQWDQIDAEIRGAKKSGLDEVHIPSLKNWADAEYPTDNPRYWPNICYSKYYDINVLAPPRQP